MTKVMLVEDDNNLREIYEARLQAEGYDIVAAKDGEEALVMAKEHRPELVISDVMMPKISGFEMLDILRNTDGLKDVKVIMLTALGQSDDQARADKLGADRYLVKSQVTLEDIVTVAKELIDGEVAPTPPVVAAPVPPVPATAVPVPAAAAEPIAVVAEPVAVIEPVVVAAEPVVVAEPAVVAEPTAATDTSSTQSTAQEEASVEAKIEDFIAGATPQPPIEPEIATPEPPVADPVIAAPEPVAAPQQTEAEAATASDDKLMSNAVDALVANTGGPAPSPDAIAAPETPVDPANVVVNGKKVISPVATDPAKPDLAALLAIEDAKDIAAASASAPMPQVAPAVPATTVAPLTPGGIDPNSIAL